MGQPNCTYRYRCCYFSNVAFLILAMSDCPHLCSKMWWPDDPILIWIPGGSVSGGILIINVLCPNKRPPNPREI